MIAGACRAGLAAALVLLQGCTLDDPRAAEQEPASIVAPAGMVYVPGGATRIGSATGARDEQPVFTIRVQPFFMDVHPVTVAEFRAFVEATKYVTDAERLGDAGVLDADAGTWVLVPGATWHHPLGPAGQAAPDDHPVTQVSWNDANAFARWAGKRLPTEFEWEHAARAGRHPDEEYVWGSARVSARLANTWEGEFPQRNTAEDGYLRTSPVGAFGATPLGLEDMAGNVWEWTASPYVAYDLRDHPVPPGIVLERVQRGGSFLCHESYCHGYRVSARSHSSPETALFHVGFRLVKDL